jgi:PKD repeat protein
MEHGAAVRAVALGLVVVASAATAGVGGAGALVVDGGVGTDAGAGPVGTVDATASDGFVTGTVRDTNLRTLSGATVELSPAGKDETYSVQTDANGDFFLVVPGYGTDAPYDVTVRKSGYETYTATGVTVEPNSTVSVPVTLLRASPDAVLDAGATTVTVGQSVAFDASGSTAPDGDVDAYRWSFGDGDAATGERVYHTFESTGTYTVELTVADDGLTDTATTTITVEADDGGSGGGDGSGSNVTVERVVPSKPGTLLNDVVFRNTYTAEVNASEPIDRVEFELAGQTYVDRDGSDGWNSAIDVSVLEGDAPLAVTAYTEDGETDTYTAGIDIVDVPDWLVELNESGSVSYDDGVLTITKQVPNPPVDAEVTVPGVPVVGGKQEFETRAAFGIVYDMPDGTARVMGSGTLDVRVAGREGSGTLGASGTVSTRTWELQRGQVYVQVSIEAWSSTVSIPGVPYSPEADLSVSPRAKLLANLSTDGGSVAVTNGTISPGIQAEGEVAVDAGVASVTGTVTGTTTGHVDVPAPYDPRVEATIEGELELETLSYEQEYDRTFFDASIGGGTSSLGTADVVETSGWQPQPKRGEGPALGGDGSGVSTAGAGDGSLGATSADATPRLTNDDLDDDAPAVARNGSGAIVVWSRQPADNAVDDGRDLFWAERSADGGWSAPSRLTDDTRTQIQPAVARDAANDRTVVVWTELNRSLATVSTPTSVYDRLEIYYAVRSGGSWSAPTLLSTGPPRMDANPRVVADDGRVVVAWTSDADANATTADDRTLRAAVLDGSPSPTAVVSGIARARLGADGDAATPVSVAYLDPAGPAGRNGTVVVGSLDATAGGVSGTTAYPVTRLTALSAGAGEFAWATAPNATTVTAASAPTIRVATASTGTTATLAATNATRVTDLAVSTTGGAAAADRALVYRAATAGDRPRYRYALQRAGTWGPDRPLLDRVASGTVLWQPTTAPTATGFEAVLVARPLVANGTGDLLAARHDLRPDLSVRASVADGSTAPNASVGDTVTLRYTVRNAGDVATGQSVALGVEGGTNATVPTLAPGETTTGIVDVTVPADGTVALSVDPDDAVTELTAANDTAELRLAPVDVAARTVTTSRTGSTIRVAGTVANVGPTDVAGVAYELRTGDGTVLDAGTVSLAAGANATVTATANASAFTPPGSAVLVVDPADALAEADETNGRADAAVLRPDVGIAGEAVAFERDGTDVIATVPVSNRGAAGANVTVRAYANGSAVATTTARVGRPGENVTAAFTTVRLRLPSTVANASVTLSVDAVADADRSDNVGTAMASVGPIETAFPSGVPGVSDAIPTDTDGDGVLEDVDGDGRFDFLDVVGLLFADYGTINGDPARQAALDHDGSGKVDFLDVVTLLFEL